MHSLFLSLYAFLQCLCFLKQHVCVCAVSPEPIAQFAHFNDIGHAMLTFFVAITLEGWVDVMYNVQVLGLGLG